MIAYDRPVNTNDPAYDAILVTGTNAANLVRGNAGVNGTGVLPRGLYVGGTGDVVVQMANSTNTATFTAVPGGTILPIVIRSCATNGATSILALY